MKKLKIFLCLTLLLTMIFSVNASAIQWDKGSAQSGDVPYQSYTYWVDYNQSSKTPVYSKPMYEAKIVLNSKALGVDDKSSLMDVVTDNNGNVYVLDSGNSRIYILNSSYELTKTLSSFTYNGEEITFVSAQGIFVDKNGLIYIADTENARVLVMDDNGVINNLLLLPDSELIPTEFNYRPIKVVVDSNGYTYIASDGSFYGAILYSPEMEFLGFYGANTVKSSVLDVLSSFWKKLTSNDIKRAADELTLPFAFSDIVLGPNDFIYTTTGTGEDQNIATGQICILNPGGKDILGKSDFNFADVAYGYYEYSHQVQVLNCLDVDENGFIYALDSTYGRIFWYDSDCNLFSVFGGSLGPGTQDGTFSMASALALNGTDVLVTDSKKNTLTVFSITEFGSLVRNAQIISLDGDFAKTKDDFVKAISLDTNCQIAYRGLAKAYYDLGDNDKAMEYAKLGADRETYAKAFEVARTDMLINNFGWLLAGLLIIIAIIIVVKIRLKKKDKKLQINKKLKVALTAIAHPAENFRMIREEEQSSVLISCVLLVTFYIVTILNDTLGGFAFTVFDSENYNALYVLISTVGFVFLWVVANWLVCTLMGGIGKLNEIFSVTCYSLVPIIASRAIRVVLTHILVPNEGAFLDIFMTVCVIYAVFMLVIGMMRIHDYEFGKFVGTTIMTVVFMLIIIFLIFLMFMLTQQVTSWGKTVYTELIYR